MELVISTETVLEWAKLLTALSCIGGAVGWCVKFVSRQKKQAEELAATRRELTVLCYGVLACLKGLQEQGCNGPVTEARNRLEKHLNQAAHHIDELIGM